jgi:hypothetical protein
MYIQVLYNIFFNYIFSHNMCIYLLLFNKKRYLEVGVAKLLEFDSKVVSNSCMIKEMSKYFQYILYENFHILEHIFKVFR